MKRMLINATQPEELRVALVDGQSIYDFDIEQIGQERKKSNIYKARVSRIEQSLGAAFVDFGSERHGFLPVKELTPLFFKNSGKNKINEALTEGQEILVQVEKEERANKGAALTTFISLPGHYLVLMPNNADAGGISKSIQGEARETMKAKLRSLNVPDNMGLILRTAGKGVTLEELQWDLDYLLSVWDAIQEANLQKKAPFLIFRENDLISRSLRDFLRDDITEVLIDSDEAYEKACEFTSRLMPDYEEKVKKYDEPIPLFTRYQIESQIETAYQREVTLPSGGSIVIDQTEALVAIDINSSKSTKGSDIEETALDTNLEAAYEISRQLRLRDIGGLVVIDFIDMLSLKNKRAVEDRLNTSLSIDRAKVQIGRISRFGLMEMSRQRLRPSLEQRWTQGVASLSTAVLRLIEEEASKKKSGEVRAIVSSDMSIFLLNERRSRINEIEERTQTRVIVVSDPSRSDNRFEVTRLRSDTKGKDSPSYDIQNDIDNDSITKLNYKKNKQEKAAVKLTPPKKPRKKGSFFKNILKIFESDEDNINKKVNNKNRKPRKINKSNRRPKKYQSKTKSSSSSQKSQNKGAENKTKKGNKLKNNKQNQKKDLKKNKQTKDTRKEKDNTKNKLSNQENKSKERKQASQSIKNEIKTETDNKENIQLKNEKENKPKVEKENKPKVEKENKPKVEEQNKSPKKWGRASNDPRNKKA